MSVNLVYEAVGSVFGRFADNTGVDDGQVGSFPGRRFLITLLVIEGLDALGVGPVLGTTVGFEEEGFGDHMGSIY